MTLMRWRRPQTTMPTPTMFDDMDRWLDRLFRSPLARAFETDSFDFGPAVDVYETDDEVVVKAELPGVKKEDINLSIEDDRLLLSGESRHEEEVKEEGYHSRELRYGNFHRVVPMPTAVKQDEIAASFDNGILTVRAPKAEEKARGKKVEIN